MPEDSHVSGGEGRHDVDRTKEVDGRAENLWKPKLGGSGGLPRELKVRPEGVSRGTGDRTGGNRCV